MSSETNEEITSDMRLPFTDGKPRTPGGDAIYRRVNKQISGQNRY